MQLITRSDFDGLTSAVLLVEKGIVDEYKFVHPKDVQAGEVEVTSNDVLANVPYAPGCGLWFDHHSSEEERLKMDEIKFEGASHQAPSTAQVIWDYYGGSEGFKNHLMYLVEAANKCDSGNLSTTEILIPSGFILINFIMDPRTGLGRFKDFRISNYQLMEDLIQYCRTMSEDEILQLPDVVERTKRYFEQQKLFQAMLKRCCTRNENVIITDLLNEETIFCGNRFLVFSLNPKQNIEVRLMWGKGKEIVVISCGYSIVNRSSKTDVGRLMLKYGGGGHKQVGTCQVPATDKDRVKEEIVAQIIQDG